MTAKEIQGLQPGTRVAVAGDGCLGTIISVTRYCVTIRWDDCALANLHPARCARIRLAP